MLIPNWRAVLAHAWSVRLILLAGILSGLDVAMPYLDGLLPVNQGVFAMLSGIVSALAIVARLLPQRRVTEGKP